MGVGRWVSGRVGGRGRGKSLNLFSTSAASSLNPSQGQTRSGYSLYFGKFKCMTTKPTGFFQCNVSHDPCNDATASNDRIYFPSWGENTIFNPAMPLHTPSRPPPPPLPPPPQNTDTSRSTVRTTTLNLSGCWIICFWIQNKTPKNIPNQSFTFFFGECIRCENIKKIC